MVKQAVSSKMSELSAEEIEFEPLYDYCLCDPIPVNRTEGGLHLPDNVNITEAARMKVIKTGPGHFDPHTGAWFDNPVKPGDILYCIGMQAPFTVMVKGHIFLCISARLVVGITRAENVKKSR